MSRFATTKLSPTGEIALPEDLRRRLDLQAGAEFVVIAEDNVIVLKVLRPPAMEDFDHLVRRARRAARQAGMKPADVLKAVAQSRPRRPGDASNPL